jgi:hypothetical protein
MVGNEQIISRWPARSGALVEGDIVYFTAGMWARDGIYVYALKTGDGSIIWRNDTCGYRYNSVPHSEGMAGVVPQGFMALHEDTLVVTTGRGSPALFDRKSGKLLAHRNGWSKLHTPGGSWAMAGKGAVFFERCVTAGDRRVPPGEADFRKEELGTGLLAIDCRTGHEVFATRDRSRGVLAGDTMLLYGGGPVMSVDAGGFFRVAKDLHADPGGSDRRRGRTGRGHGPGRGHRRDRLAGGGRRPGTRSGRRRRARSAGRPRAYLEAWASRRATA